MSPPPPLPAPIPSRRTPEITPPLPFSLSHSPNATDAPASVDRHCAPSIPRPPLLDFSPLPHRPSVIVGSRCVAPPLRGALSSSPCRPSPLESIPPLVRHRTPHHPDQRRRRTPSSAHRPTSPKSAFALAAYARPRSDRRHRRCRRTHSSPSTPPASPLPTTSTRSSGEDQDIIHVLNRSQIGGHQVQLSWSLTPHQNKQVHVQS